MIVRKKIGHYEIVSELGRGGMGVVYKAWEPSLNRYVAIKALGEHLLEDKMLVERFIREAKSMAAINHPNVIQIYYIGNQQNRPYFAMELIEGVSLDHLMKQQNPLNIEDAKAILRQACGGLSIAHETGLVHRDIKPANIMICRDGTVKVADFGIAQTREYGDKLTATGEFVGTPGYLSPEVCTGQPVDQRSDVFALGIVFYEMLSGKVPFENDSPLGLMLEVVQAKIPDIRSINSKVDKKTHYILQKMIAKNPDERFQNCSEIIQQLGSVKTLSFDELITGEMPASEPSNKTAEVSVLQTVVSSSGRSKNSHQSPSKRGIKGVAVLMFGLLSIGLLGLAHKQGLITLPFIQDATEAEPLTLIGGQSQDLKYQDLALLETPKQKEQIAQSSAEPKPEGGRQVTALAANEHSENKKIAVQVGELNALPSEKNLTTLPQKHEKTAQLNIGNSSVSEPSKQSVTSPALVKNTTANEQTIKPLTSPHKQPKSSADQALLDKQMAYVAVPSHFKEKTTKGTQKSSRQKAVSKIDRGITVLVFGEASLAEELERALKAELRQANLKVVNEQFIPNLNRLLAQQQDLSSVKKHLWEYGSKTLVIANADLIGGQRLQYYGRNAQLINARIEVNSYDLKNGDAIDAGYDSKLSYTSLNVSENVQQAVSSFADDLTGNIHNKLKTKQ